MAAIVRERGTVTINRVSLRNFLTKKCSVLMVPFCVTLVFFGATQIDVTRSIYGRFPWPRIRSKSWFTDGQVLGGRLRSRSHVVSVL